MSSALSRTRPGASFGLRILLLGRYHSSVVARSLQVSTRRAQGAIVGRDYVVKLPGLWRARLRAALSQRDLAKKAGVSPSTIARIESGEESQPSTLRKLAAALEVEPRELMEL